MRREELVAIDLVSIHVSVGGTDGKNMRLEKFKWCLFFCFVQKFDVQQIPSDFRVEFTRFSFCFLNNLNSDCRKSSSGGIALAYFLLFFSSDCGPVLLIDLLSDLHVSLIR